MAIGVGLAEQIKTLLIDKRMDLSGFDKSGEQRYACAVDRVDRIFARDKSLCSVDALTAQPCMTCVVAATISFTVPS